MKKILSFTDVYLICGLGLSSNTSGAIRAGSIPAPGTSKKTQHYAGSFCLYPFSTPVSCADSPFQGHTAFRSRFSRASPLLRFSAKILLTRMTRR